jgi:hypothetical protein
VHGFAILRGRAHSPHWNVLPRSVANLSQSFVESRVYDSDDHLTTILAEYSGKSRTLADVSKARMIRWLRRFSTFSGLLELRMYNRRRLDDLLKMIGELSAKIFPSEAIGIVVHEPLLRSDP